MQLDLLEHHALHEVIPGMVLLRNFFDARELENELQELLLIVPFRSMTVPSGKSMSVRTSSAGRFGWVSDASGYRYSTVDPIRNAPWPSIPERWIQLAKSAAARADFVDFIPDSCLMNAYAPGARMGLHQDRNEHDFTQPIVSFSCGADAAFVFGSTTQRTGKTQSIVLGDGDVLVFGGPARMCYHGIKPLRTDGSRFSHRTNLTFRRVAGAAQHGIELAS